MSVLIKVGREACAISVLEFFKEEGMAAQADQVGTGKKIAIAIGSLIIAGLYFLIFLDWFAMKIQGLDYFYLFRK